MRPVMLLALLPALVPAAQDYTRGIGVYPGDPREYAGPALVADTAAYRNLALHRPAYHSSSYDYNLTAQLVTDGIKETALPGWLAVGTSEQNPLPRFERELVFDHNWVSTVPLKGRHGWIQFAFQGGGDVPVIDHVDVDGTLVADGDLQEWTVTLSSSTDGRAWQEIGRSEGVARPGGEIHPSIPLKAVAQSRFYRLDFLTGRELEWKVGEVKFSRSGKRVEVGGPWKFSSAWKSAGAGEEWVYVDLGAQCTFDRVVLSWIRRASAGAVQVSSDAAAWKTVQPLPATGATDDLKLGEPAHGRYVRVLMTTPATPDGYILSELEVYGRGGLVPRPKPAESLRADGVLPLAGGAWRLQRDSLVKGGGAELSKPGFADAEWLVATVPATVLTSYLNAGALPDPNYGDQQELISDSFFFADFWYRTEFVAPKLAAGRRAWLNFQGINWKADVFLNGQKLGRIEGGFQRGRFDVTSLLHAGQKNALAVRVEKNATPGAMKEKTWDSPGLNGGALGADNPTYHASIGWDWIPTIRGRNTGIWGDVFVQLTGPVTIENPFVDTKLPLPDTSRADVSIAATLRNHSAQAVSGVLHGKLGEVAFEQRVTVPASSETVVKLDPSTHAQLRMANPKLWWPNGYGEPNLYASELRFVPAGGEASDTKKFQVGLRQFTYADEMTALKIWINGRRFVPRGGNWGFGESMLRYRGREYDTAVRYHREMNFTMIRNWVGQIGDEELYEACDRHGIVVWQDFWLANPWDGPEPDDHALFLHNMEDFVLRIRNHASVGLYCGRNEGYPELSLETGMRKILAQDHPGIVYISSSADDGVGGRGPYRAMPPRYYFAERATPKFHSELGMPSIMTMDSIRATIPEKDLWPQGRMWGIHDFSLHGAQGGESFRAIIDKSYGGAANAEEWVELAQFVNYEGYRAMFEAQGKNRQGLLIWMSHPSWPSLVWQTYDYFFDTGAAYFGSKKASEPLHIQWNPVTETVEVVNYSGGNAPGLTAEVQVLNMDGSVKWTRTAPVDSKEDSLVPAIKMEYPADLTPVHFLKLRLTRGASLISENFYWRGRETDDYRALRQLPKVPVEARTTVQEQGNRWMLSTELENCGAAPALMVRVKAVREKTQDRILPAFYSDNYIALLPGEKRIITTELNEADTRGEKPSITVDGFNTILNR